MTVLASAATSVGASTADLRNVNVVYGDEVSALRDVSLSVRAGETVALVGPSGAGKSTLLRLLNATVTARSGSVVVNGTDVQDSPEWRRLHGSAVALIPQQLHLVGRLRVIHNVNAGALSTWSTARALRSLVRPVDVAVVEELCAQLGIGELVRSRTDRLSGGQQQRVAIARALRQNPSLMLADEPTASLDPVTARGVMELLRTIAESRSVAVIVSQHDAELALATCDRVIGLRGGSVVLDAPTADVARRDLDAVYAA